MEKRYQISRITGTDEQAAYRSVRTDLYRQAITHGSASPDPLPRNDSDKATTAEDF